MFLLYWTVIIVFSISVTTVVSESQVGTSGFTERTIVPSSTPDCQSPSCLTWLQCLADSSQCFTSYTTVTILQGEYILHEYVAVYDVVSLSIYGSRSEMDGSARKNQVVINCEYREGGIGFTNGTNFSLSGITMVNCGVRVVDRGFRKLPYFALQVSEGVNVNLSFLFIINSTQFGLVCMNLLGTSGIRDSVITHSNYRLLEKYMQGEVECLKNSWGCSGSNMCVMFFNSLIKVAPNISNFTVERTKISYGVNLELNDNRFSGGAGVLVVLSPELEYNVEITIAKCLFMNNIDAIGAHLYLELLSNCSVRVEDSNFTYANRITEGDPIELIPVVHHHLGPLFVHVNDVDRTAINVQIVMNKVHIAENVGGGLHASFYSQLSQSYVQLRLNEIDIIHNFLIQHTDFNVYGFFVRFEELRTKGGRVYTSLESVEISSNVLLLQGKNPWNQAPEPRYHALSTTIIEVHFQQTRFFNNSVPAVSSYNSDLHFHGVNVFRKNTGGQCGGALVLMINSHIYLHRGTQVYILENTALEYGGGICVNDGSVPELVVDVCFYQIVDAEILNNNDTFVYMEGNVAPITGYDIYAGTVGKCFTLFNFTGQSTNSEKVIHISRAIFAHVFCFGFLNISLGSWYQVSSRPVKICFCYPGPELMCNDNVVPSIGVYPG